MPNTAAESRTDRRIIRATRDGKHLFVSYAYTYGCGRPVETVSLGKDPSQAWDITGQAEYRIDGIIKLLRKRGYTVMIMRGAK